MQRHLFITVLILFVAYCSSQDIHVPRPTFPDAFQTMIEAIFVKENEIVELDGDLYYDRNNNKAAFQITLQGTTTKTIYDFNSNELIVFDGKECIVDVIPDNPQKSFFSFTLDENNKKKIVAPEEVLYFSKSELLKHGIWLIPTLVYSGIVDIPAYDRKNCEVTHVFTKPAIERPDCVENQLCEPRLMGISVKCRDDKNITVVDHNYSFFRFTSGIVDDSTFLPPAGMHCNIKNTKKFPLFPPYFSFAFEVVQKMKETENYTAVFSTLKEVWYDDENIILRIDEYDGNGLLGSYRVLDVTADTAFVIIPITSKCDKLPIPEKPDFPASTTLPKVFFDNETANSAVYVGKRTIDELTYEVWSYTWADAMSSAKIVEEYYFLEIQPESDLSYEKQEETYLRISHVDKYTYEMRTQLNNYDLTVFETIGIFNYRTSPKEYDDFDVSTCFDRSQRRDFLMKLEGLELVKESQAYHEILEHLYNKITDVTGVSVLRISQLTGVFDGNLLTGVKGSIIENTHIAGWLKNKQPGMNEVFNIMKNAASEGKLTVTYKQQYSKEVNTFKVTSVEDVENPVKNGYSGGSMAAATIILFLIGIVFGVAGYYVFLKKKGSNV